MSVKGILLDMGGVLYVGEKPIERAVETLNLLRENFSLRFLTNTTRKAPKSVIEKMNKMGFSIKEEELFTALSAMKSKIEQKRAKTFPILTDEAKEYFKDFIVKENEKANFVIIGDAGENFTYSTLNEAFRKIIYDNASILAAAINRYFKDDDGKLSMDAGGFVKALEYASEKEALIVGKPSKEFFLSAVKSMNLDPKEVIMVGDDIENDIKGAQNAGIKAILVKTGKFRPQDLNKGIKPDAVIEDISHLPSLLQKL